MEKITKHILIVLGTLYILRYILGVLSFVVSLLTQYEQAVFVFQWAKYRGHGGADESPGELPPFKSPPLSDEDLDQFLTNLGLTEESSGGD